MNSYLIPANSKKSMLILGLFYPFDLILLGCGGLLTIILVAILPIESITFAMISIAPISITAFLVFPVPNHHNVLTVIISAITFFTSNQRFIWKGWCVRDGEKDKK